MKYLVWSMLLGSLVYGTEPSPNPFALYQEVAQKIKDESIYAIDDKRLMNSCLEGMITHIDKNGQFLNEEDYDTLYVSSKPVAGIGISIVKKQNRFYVKSVVEHSPAEKANIQKGDELVQVDATLARELSFEELIAQLRGMPNTKLKVTLLKPNSSKTTEVQLTRKIITIDVITTLMFDHAIAYVKISSFAQDGLKEMLEEVSYLHEVQGKNLKGMILDLRDNPGGIFTSGIAIASLFLEKDKVILNVKSRHKEDKKQYRNHPEDFDGTEYAQKIEELSFLRTIPLVILVNNDSAGSSEIVASVLQEYNRAIVIGTPTFGKDTFATLFPLNSQPVAIKFATARWNTPKGKSVWPNGVIPNTEIKQDENDKKDTVLQEALRILQKK